MWSFEGDTVACKAVARTNDGEVAISSMRQHVLTLKNSASVTRVLWLNNLGAGPHVMQISAYLDRLR